MQDKLPLFTISLLALSGLLWIVVVILHPLTLMALAGVVGIGGILYGLRRL